MKFVKQPAGTPFCGQVAVAAITGKSLGFVRFLIHSEKRGTKTRELVAALRKLGWEAESNRCLPIKYPFDHPLMADFFNKTQLAQVRGSGYGRSKSGWHWVAIGNGCVYDGSYSRQFPSQMYLSALECGRITSSLCVWKRKL